MANCIQCGRQLPPLSFGKKLCQWCQQHEAAQRGELGEDAKQRVMPAPWVQREGSITLTRVIFGINVAVFLGMALATGSVEGFPGETRVHWGANYGPYTLSGDWWRLLSYMFLHGDLMHIAFNMWCLWDLGALCESLYGRWTFAAVYLLTGIAGGVASVAWNPGVLSVGASGAIFGLAGALIASFYLGEFSLPSFAIRFNGKTDASTGEDMATQILLGQLPLLWSPDSARVAVVGYGSGVTAGSALTHPLAALDLLEIEPAVLEADRIFRPFNNNPLADPRLAVHLEDGRMFLAHAAHRYDAIISEPSNPWLVGVNNLFTVDFYRLAKQHLAPTGVFCQWVQYYELSGGTLASLARSMAAVFPHAQVFLVDRDLLIVATVDGGPLDLDRVAQRLARPQVAKDLARAGVRTPADLVDEVAERIRTEGPEGFSRVSSAEVVRVDRDSH